jgi:hypothetical protein
MSLGSLPSLDMPLKHLGRQKISKDLESLEFKIYFILFYLFIVKNYQILLNKNQRPIFFFQLSHNSRLDIGYNENSNSIFK